MKNIYLCFLVAILMFGFVLPVLAQQNQQQQGVQTQAQTQGQAQTQNLGEEEGLQIQERVRTMTKTEIKEQMKERARAVNGEEHRSAVANFVHSLLDVAEREKGGIGEQVRVVAQEQARVQEKVADQIEAIEKRNKIKTFLIGTDYKNIGALRSEMVQLRNRIQQINQVMEQVKNEEDRTELMNQIQAMEQEMTNIAAFIKANESKFSLFGWLVKLFN